MEEFNLLVTCPRDREEASRLELEDALREMGDDSPEVWTVGVRGLLLAKTSLNPFEVVSGIREMVLKNPFSLVNLRRVIPIERVVRADPEEIADAVEGLASKIGEGESYRVTVEKRHTTLSRMEVIRAAAARVPRKVDLENPDWIVLVEIVGPVAGVSVLRPGDVVSIEKLRG